VETSYSDARGRIVRREMGAMRPGSSGRAGPAVAFDGRSNLIGLRGPGFGDGAARRQCPAARTRGRRARE